ncbi:hypothetical protein V0288_16060 [Pannus brasiliensis CCIBt3594]|uniref:Uncharacterized protein n=1 Tax=Pannus brasiliensis CCIBt3594 TaxID=1427578 RepID=A0AAW9QXZ1_9CHRO
MNDSFSAVHPSIERLLRQSFPLANNGEPPRLPVYRSLLAGDIVYRCPLQYAFSIERRAEIVRRFVAISGMNVTLADDGWLEIRLDDRALWLWLRGLVESLDRFFPYHPPREPNPRFFFLFQYTHARCCSRLRLAEREGIVDPPSSVPSYNPVERALFLQLLTVVDRPETARKERLAGDFCRSLLDLDRFCRLVGEPVEIARSRVQLLSIGQRLLRSFLAREFAIAAIEGLDLSRNATTFAWSGSQEPGEGIKNIF